MSKNELPQKNIKDITSEELALALGNLFEQAFKIQQEIHTITAELLRRKKDNDDATDER